ncbi:hypothetical protein VV089_05725 [Candidatus Merdisoma sp. JLR.KK011]|uniref:hypothetical protein n=1 Tax=Candidatus Merdisoma sp. JLR.KK011 TaxID=3114299 RepID=UPI002FF1DBAB
MSEKVFIISFSNSLFYAILIYKIKGGEIYLNIYLDNCCYNRPFDDQSQIKIHLEAQAKLHIQGKIREGIYDLTWSYILDYENGKNPYEEKRMAIAPWRTIASTYISEETEAILTFAESLALKGIKTYDALHISCAVAAHCEYYLTTDKKLLNTPIPEIKIVSPIVFVNEMEE